jgi:hypothetical protein
MQIEVTLKQGRKLLASKTVSDPKPGDLTVVVGRLFADARKLLDAYPWDCQITVRRISRADGGFKSKGRRRS